MSVKSESQNQDEAEIRALAQKITEENKSKMQQASVAATVPAPVRAPIVAVPVATPSAPSDAVASAADKIDDFESVCGRFGWTLIYECYLPFITRNDEKYVSVRMMETDLTFSQYLKLFDCEFYRSCSVAQSYYITEAECRLLNEINCRHCDNRYGRSTFSRIDVLIKLTDAIEFANFLLMCYNKVIVQKAPQPLPAEVAARCGFVQINFESVVPYALHNAQKYIPLFYFESESDTFRLDTETLEGWDLAYLKFCCKLQGIRADLYKGDTCTVITLENVKSYFPPGTVFEENHWPAKTKPNQLLNTKRAGQDAANRWFKLPVGEPLITLQPVFSVMGARINGSTLPSIYMPHVNNSAAAVAAGSNRRPPLQTVRQYQGAVVAHQQQQHHQAAALAGRSTRKT